VSGDCVIGYKHMVLFVVCASLLPVMDIQVLVKLVWKKNPLATLAHQPQMAKSHVKELCQLACVLSLCRVMLVSPAGCVESR
jgi:hypothetical protein